MNKKNLMTSLQNAFLLTLFNHVQNSISYAKAFLLEKPSYTPREPLMLLGYFLLLFLLFFLARIYGMPALMSILSVSLIFILAIRMESRRYLEWLGYQSISVGLPAQECGKYYDPGVTFQAIDPYTNLPVSGFVCWSDFSEWQSNYYTN